ncbi:MAG: UbiA family prenyltransferase [Candidatus Methanoperedens sp.]|nr:UbiA family prenyltransferase [Candidatus Methanoperedens sp.]
MISSTFIAITGFLLPYFSFLLYDVRANFNLLLASSLCMYAIYSLNKLADIKEDLINTPERVGFIAKYKYYISFSVVISIFASMFLSFSQNPFAILIILFPFLMGIFYSIKIFGFRLKDVIGVKNITVALSWAVVGTLLPLATNPRSIILISLVFYFFLLGYLLDLSHLMLEI